MRILRPHARRNNFTTIGNDILYSTLSLEAKGLYAILLSLGGDGQEFHPPHLLRLSYSTEDKLTAVLNELKENGYVELSEGNNIDD